MAEAVVSYTVQKIGDLLIQEAVFLYDVRDKVNRLQNELKRMQRLLEVADCWQVQDPFVHNLLAEIRNIAYDADDVIDNFILKVALREDGLRGVLHRFASAFTKVPHLYRIGTQIKCIETKIEDIKKSWDTFTCKIPTNGERTTSVSEIRKTYPHFRGDEDEVISLDDSTKEVMAKLMKDEKDCLQVVSIVGMGGLGKTTLAKKVYNQIDVKKHFDCQAWVFVSQQFVTKDVLYGILMDIIIDRSSIERDDQLALRLYKELKGKRYLIVLDDIWDIAAWHRLESAFPDEEKGSKILFTTRNKEVASRADSRAVLIEPPLLTHDRSWELLQKKAFGRKSVDGHDCSPEFETLGRQIVKECRGLPLAIVLLGGLLASKKSTHEWKVVQGKIIKHLQQQQQRPDGGVHGILSLSYQDLPHYLKPCFLYIGVFPEDSEIRKSELIRLWIAEGFISSQKAVEEEKTIEDLAKVYLEDLVSRCMLQVDKKDHTGRGIKTCRIHDLLRDLSLLKGREFNFLEAIQAIGSSSSSSSSIQHSSTTQSRRVSIYFDNNHERYVPLPKAAEYPYLRSLLYFARDRDACENGSGSHLYKRFMLLRVLRLDFVRLGSVPKAIGNLIHLRYLGLRETGVSELPKSIGNLGGLHTLDVRNNGSLRLPRAISRLKRLRHLLYSSSVDLQKWDFHVNDLTDLETLKHLNFENLIRDNEVLRLSNLRNLGVTCERSEQVEKVLESPSDKFGRLQSLNMVMQENNPFPENMESLSQCRHLSKLNLKGSLNSPRHSLQFLPDSLAKLILVDSKLSQDPMTVLERLTNLRFLRLGRDAYTGSRMVCSAQWFPQLEILEFHALTEVEVWQVEKGAMPSLRRLTIDSMRNLKMIPEGLMSVTTLQELNIYFMETFKNRFRVAEGIEGEDFYKVCHIPSISFDNLPLTIRGGVLHYS